MGKIQYSEEIWCECIRIPQTVLDPENTAKDTDLPACFKITPQPDAHINNVAATAAESPIGTWTAIWTDLN